MPQHRHYNNTSVESSVSMVSCSQWPEIRRDRPGPTLGNRPGVSSDDDKVVQQFVSLHFPTPACRGKAHGMGVWGRESVGLPAPSFGGRKPARSAKAEASDLHGLRYFKLLGTDIWLDFYKLFQHFQNMVGYEYG